MAIKVFADGANLEGMLDMYENGNVQGFTTNPSLMKKGGVADYRAFAKEVLAHITDVSVSFEVFADGIKVNVTTIFTPKQVDEMVEAVDAETPSIISLFAGRIADTGVDPIPFMAESVKKAAAKPSCEVLWASTRSLSTFTRPKPAAARSSRCPTASWPSARTSVVTRTRFRSIPCAALPRTSPLWTSIFCRNANTDYAAGCSPRPFLSLSLTRFARVALGKGKAGAADTSLPVGSELNKTWLVLPL